MWSDGNGTIFAAELLIGETYVSTDNVVLEHLRAIRGTVERLSEDMQEVKTRLGILENQYASISSRLDRLDARVLRIEKRLDLVDA